NIEFSTAFFRVEDSIALVSMAVIGGLGSLGGAVIGALWVVGLPEFWPTNTTVPLLTSSIGLLIILLYLPGGFIQLGYSLRGMLFRWLEQRLPERPVKVATEPPTTLRRAGSAAMPISGDALEAQHLRVEFGGLVAVNDVAIRAAPGEVVGLIGTNGAGKSTLLNAIGGFVRSTGDVMLLGQSIAHLPAHRRARLGLGRTFQAATLFPELTVRDTVALALEAREPTSYWHTVLFPFGAARRERAKRADANEI